VANFLMIKGK